MFEKRKIAFFLPDMAGGGAERVQLAIMRHLVAAGHQVDLILAFGGGVLLPLVPPEVRIIELRAGRLGSSLVGLVRYLKAKKPWSLHAIMWPCTVLAVAAKMVARSNAKLLLSDHTFLSDHYASPRTRRILRLSMKALYPRAEHRVAVSKGAAADVAKLAGLSDSEVEVIYNPVDLPEVVAENAAARQQWQGASPRIISVGAFKAEKNHDLLIRAFARVVQRFPDARLVILGEGALRAHLEALRDDLGLGDKVRLPGFQLDPWPYLAGADLFVLSSDYEGMSLVLVEALHAGLKVVSTDCEAGPAELLQGGNYGRLSPVGDGAALARAMIEELETASDPGRQRVRASEITGRRNLERYEQLLAG
ncbi:glycosyltransferase involved in cell wall biosynthesis [Sphingomonas kaistensis]|uniref:Glycosyltransferase involved in cell wall biosynthesis n=1 Tax=Sphingomonas kaistensis TaxID=298708 RepID=A0A7X5Y9M3_9SPHN|nr:glycosyltransferase [Sphingomonas kaistensis]NJC06475.1 glycosyltransferase involved in cell wall biosynthesis [Sphingomonas kaistensis]